MSEVIIDGCNVAECEFFRFKYKLNNSVFCEVCTLWYNACLNNPDCYFKQLQRAKAELEQYKKSVVRELKASDKIEFKQFYKAENNKLKAENDTLHITISKLKEDLSQAETSLYAWKAENEKLKEKLHKHISKGYCECEFSKNLKAENERLKEEVADLEDLAEFKEKYIRELSSNINVKIGQITAMEMFNKQANEYNLKYKQALKKIEEIAYTTDFDIVDIQEIVDEVLK